MTALINVNQQFPPAMLTSDVIASRHNAVQNTTTTQEIKS